MTEHHLTTLLKARYAKPEWCFMPQVRNGTGYARKTTRTADGLALSLYPSRGIFLHGFEIKVARSDWRKELAEPDKAESIAQFCDYWWVVAPDGVVPMDELPPTWGLLVANERKLAIAKQAIVFKDAKPLDRLQLAAIFKEAQSVVCPQEEIDAAVYKARIEVANAERIRRDESEARWQRRLADTSDRIQRFQEASGIRIDDWRLGNIAKLMDFIRAGGVDGVRGELESLARNAQAIADKSRELLAVELQEAPC